MKKLNNNDSRKNVLARFTHFLGNPMHIITLDINDKFCIIYNKNEKVFYMSYYSNSIPDNWLSKSQVIGVVNECIEQKLFD